MTTCDVAIVGAGPYGLSAAAHLRAIKGLECKLFGQAMSFWKQHMPQGMFLRSPLEGSNLSDPEARLSLDAYAKANGDQLVSPFPLESFVKYGTWFQQQVARDIDTRNVTRIQLNGNGFQLALQDGEIVKATRVVVAGGIVPFARRLPEFQGLRVTLASHSCDHRDLRIFTGKQVVVIGGGQSALESAALLHELGSDVCVVSREPQLWWTWQRPWLHTFRPIARLLYAAPDVGPAGISHLVAAPSWFRRLPRETQDRWAQRSIRPAGAGWLKPRLQDVPILMGRAVVGAVPAGGKVKIRLDNGDERSCDHLLMATGYQVDITKYGFLTAELLARVTRVTGYPELNAGFESSVPGLHFLGAPASRSFGPLMRFVAGADFATRALARYVSAQKQS